MRWIFSVAGTYGDLRPFVALAQALTRRGEETILVSNPNHTETMAQLGQAFRPCSQAWDPAKLPQPPQQQHPLQTAVSIWRRLYAPQIEEFAATIHELQEGPCAIIHHPWCFGSYFATKDTKTPRMTLSPYPLAWMAHDDLSTHQTDRLMRLFGLHTKTPMAHLFEQVMKKDLTRLARRHKQSLPKHPFLSLLGEARSHLGLWSQQLRPPLPSDPEGSQILGFPHSFEDDALTSPQLRAFMDAGEAPVVCGLGTLLPQLIPDLYKEVARACLELQHRVLLIGPSEAPLEAPSDQLLWLPYAPYHGLFPRARLVVHHGGIGTLAIAMQAGCPSLIVPCGFDQFNNAKRAHECGVAEVLPYAKIDQDSLKTALRSCLNDAALREQTSQVQAQLKAEIDGAEAAAEWLLVQDFAQA